MLTFIIQVSIFVTCTLSLQDEKNMNKTKKIWSISEKILTIFKNNILGWICKELSLCKDFGI